MNFLLTQTSQKPERTGFSGIQHCLMVWPNQPCNSTNTRSAKPTTVQAGHFTVRAEPVEAAPARLLTLTSETTGKLGEVDVTLAEHNGIIHADLSVDVNVASAVALEANENLSKRGVQLFGAGFIVTPEEAALLLPPLPGKGGGGGKPMQQIIRDYRNGCDLTDIPRGVKVIDAFALTAEHCAHSIQRCTSGCLNV